MITRIFLTLQKIYVVLIKIQPYWRRMSIKHTSVVAILLLPLSKTDIKLDSIQFGGRFERTPKCEFDIF